MQILKKQVQSLTMHQKKLEDELQQIEEKFEAKKRKFIESSDAFQEELKKHCKPAVDDDTFQRMVDRALEQMRRGINPATQSLALNVCERKDEPMDQDQNAIKQESNGPNPPTQVDKVSTTDVKPDGHVTTELNKTEPEVKKEENGHDEVERKEEHPEVKVEAKEPPAAAPAPGAPHAPPGAPGAPAGPQHMTSPPHHAMMMPPNPNAPPHAPPHGPPPPGAEEPPAKKEAE
ncbi:uncharacterized protein isoform X2 [Choristoneura fumiferana]|uniref:uncharacterized protein isoform X2 n=1 Tax=Choristoneura fumiferana TaxID=7141 RepID=UPI003D15D898